MTMADFLEKTVFWFWRRHSTVTHAIGSFIATGVLAYSNVPAFKDYVHTLSDALPTGLRELAIVAFMVWGWYRNGTKGAAPLPKDPPKLTDVDSLTGPSR